MIALWGLIPRSSVQAAGACIDEPFNLSFVGGNPPTEVANGDHVEFTVGGLVPGDTYKLIANTLTGESDIVTRTDSDGDGEITFDFTIGPNTPPPVGTDNIHIDLWGVTNTGVKCDLWHDMQILQGFSCDYITVSQERGGQTCFADGASACMDTSADISLQVNGVKVNGAPMSGDSITVDLGSSSQSVAVTNGTSAKVTFNNVGTGSHTANARKPLTMNVKDCSKIITVSLTCGEECLLVEPGDPDAPLAEAKEDPFFLCNQLPPDSDAKQSCLDCATGGGAEVVGKDESRQGIWTAVGCIKREPENIILSVIKIGLGMGGGIALLMILAAGFLISTSQGDPKKVSDAKELITAAVTGLLFIIFSVVMIEFIGYSVFKLPGFGG